MKPMVSTTLSVKTQGNKLEKFDLNEMELQIRSCNRMVKCYGSSKTSANF